MLVDRWVGTVYLPENQPQGYKASCNHYRLLGKLLHWLFTERCSHELRAAIFFDNGPSKFYSVLEYGAPFDLD